MEIDFDIDLVYLWVDGKDPAWITKRNALIGVSEEGSAVNCDGRYADNDELRYSLRSVAAYAPWIRKIFIVTDGQRPRWLKSDHPKIEIIDHKDILPADVLPTFNSVVIEHAIHNIPGLSEHFLYANDDMFFNREVRPSDFFDPEGRPIVRLNRRPFRKISLWLKERLSGRPLSNYNLTINNAARLVESGLGKYIGHKTHHNIDAYCKSDYRHAFEMFREAIVPTMANKVRSDNDIQRNLYSYVPLIEKRSVPEFVSRRTSFRFHIDNPTHYAKLEKTNPMLFCLNDSQYATDGDRKRVKDYLSHKFHEKSEFEK